MGACDLSAGQRDALRIGTIRMLLQDLEHFELAAGALVVALERPEQPGHGPQPDADDAQSVAHHIVRGFDALDQLGYCEDSDR